MTDKQVDLEKMSSLKNKNYKSFYDVLSCFPMVFSLNNYHYITHDSKELIKTNLLNWKNKGYVKSVGPRSKYYYNMIRDDKADKNYLNVAIKKVYPDAINTGVDILRKADWMTQITKNKEIIVGKQNSYKQIYNVDLKPRSKTWYKRYSDGFDRNEFGEVSLKPEYVLVDMCENEKYIPDPDDLFLDDEELEALDSVFKKLKVDPPLKYQEFLGLSAPKKKSSFKIK